MTRNGSDPSEPPWTYEAKDVEAWLSKVTRGAKLSKLEAFRDEQSRRLENLEIALDVDSVKTQVKPSTLFTQWLQELTGRASFEKHFEVPAVAELVLRALAKGNFHRIVRVKVDNQAVHDNPNRAKDVRGAVELLTEASHRATRCETIELEVLDDENGDSPATALVRRVQKKGGHAIGVRFAGDVREEDFRAFLSYLSGNLNGTFVVAG